MSLDRELVDVAYVDGRLESPYPPFPSAVLVPFVAVFGVASPAATVLAVLLTPVVAVLVARTARRLGADSEAAAWLAVAAVLGTGWWSAVLGSDTVWFWSHVVAVAALVLALHEAAHGRALTAGAALGCALLSRQLTVLGLLPVLALLAFAHRDGHRRWVAAALGPVAAAVGVYLAVNAVRFGSPFDTGYDALRSGSFAAARLREHGLWDLAYVPFNLWHLFVAGPNLSFGGDEVLEPLGMDPFGTSLTVASPFLLLGLRAGGDRRVRAAAWVAVAVVLGAHTLYFNNGFVQTNTQRFALDVVPVLLVLVALAVRDVPRWVWQATIGWAVGLNVLALWAVPRWAG